MTKTIQNDTLLELDIENRKLLTVRRRLAPVLGAGAMVSLIPPADPDG